MSDPNNKIVDLYPVQFLVDNRPVLDRQPERYHQKASLDNAGGLRDNAAPRNQSLSVYEKPLPPVD